MPTLVNVDFGELIARLARALADRELPFMLIGGQAVLLHGEPRLTQDVDVALGVSPARLDDALAACHAARLSPLPADVAGFVRDTFVCRPPTGRPASASTWCSRPLHTRPRQFGGLCS